jgi:hypothetical protein
MLLTNDIAKTASAFPIDPNKYKGLLPTKSARLSITEALITYPMNRDDPIHPILDPSAQ